jgi:hypothetical protein
VREVCHESAWGAEGNECNGSCKGKRPAGKGVGKCLQNCYKPYRGVHKKGQYPKGRLLAPVNEGGARTGKLKQNGEGVGTTHPPLHLKKRAIRIFQKIRNFPIHDGDSTRNTECDYAEEGGRSGQWERGVPPTHPHIFFQVGGTLPP